MRIRTSLSRKISLPYGHVVKRPTPGLLGGAPLASAKKTSRKPSIPLRELRACIHRAKKNRATIRPIAKLLRVFDWLVREAETEFDADLLFDYLYYTRESLMGGQNVFTAKPLPVGCKIPIIEIQEISWEEVAAVIDNVLPPGFGKWIKWEIPQIDLKEKYGDEARGILPSDLRLMLRSLKGANPSLNPIPFKVVRYAELLASKNYYLGDLYNDLGGPIYPPMFFEAMVILKEAIKRRGRDPVTQRPLPKIYLQKGPGWVRNVDKKALYAVWRQVLPRAFYKGFQDLSYDDTLYITIPRLRKRFKEIST